MTALLLKFIHLPIPFVLGLILGGGLLLLVKDPRIEFVLGFPGVVIHELAHFFVAFLLLANPESINLVPKREGDRWILGSVRFEASWWSAGPAALAPLYILPCVIYVLACVACGTAPLWQFAAGYSCAAIAWGAMPSLEDWKIAVVHPIGTAFLAAGLFMVFMTVFNGKV